MLPISPPDPGRGAPSTPFQPPIQGPPGAQFDCPALTGSKPEPRDDLLLLKPCVILEPWHTVDRDKRQWSCPSSELPPAPTRMDATTRGRLRLLTGRTRLTFLLLAVTCVLMLINPTGLWVSQWSETLDVQRRLHSAPAYSSGGMKLGHKFRASKSPDKGQVRKPVAIPNLIGTEPVQCSEEEAHHVMLWLLENGKAHREKSRSLVGHTCGHEIGFALPAQVLTARTHHSTR